MITDLRTRFEALHSQYQTMVLHLCKGFVRGDRDQAYDLCQEVFINTWNALPGFRAESSEKTWIYRITINTCLMWVRKEKKNPTVKKEDPHVLPAIQNDWGHEQIEKLYLAIGQLEELDRLIIMMVLDELEYEEISRVVGMTENNVRVKVHRIKQRIKDIMNHGRRTE